MIQKVDKDNIILKINRLSKYFGHKKAVDNVSFQVKEKSFFALLGSNGAGKTTTLNIVISFLRADGGDVFFNGTRIDTLKKVKFFKNQLGVVFQDSILDQELSVIDNLKIAASFYNLSKQEQKENINKLVEILNIQDLLKQKVKTLSGGERRKVDIARAIINNPKILLLDELTAGLDPQAQLIVWNIVKKLHESGTTIIFTTHYLEEAEKAEHVVIMNKGKVIESDDVLSLKNKYRVNYIEIKSPEDTELKKLLVASKVDFIYKNDCYHIYYKNEEQLNLYLKKLAKFLINFKVVSGSMRDVFLKAVGANIEEIN